MKESKVLEVLGLTSSDIQDMLIQGMTFPEIAKMYGVEYISLIQAYKVQRKKFKYIDYVQEKVKINEGVVKSPSYKFDQLYTWESLCLNEIRAYYKYKDKNKAYYEQRTTLV